MITKAANRTFIITALVVLGGCAATPPPKPDPEFAPVKPAAMEAPKQANGSIYQAGYGIKLFEDTKAYRVGDIIHIVLVERTQASKNAQTGLSKSNEVALGNPTILGGAAQVGSGTLQMGMDSSHEFSGQGSTSQSNSLSGNIAVTVVDVLPNGYLVVRGEKLLTLNQGSEHIRLSGFVRPTDVRNDNTVLSTHVANAQINYGGTGALADANTNGWLSQFFMKVWPF
jgi:flagellar L-ring protein precursor FlgH